MNPYILTSRLAETYVRPEEGFYRSEVVDQPGRPILTFLPMGYEPTYSYPLVVFLHGHGGSERQLMPFATRLSRRNYLCVGLRAPKTITRRRDGRRGFRWGSKGKLSLKTEEYIFSAIDQTREIYGVHPNRIYLAGVCTGATLAYRLGLANPSTFAGVVALNGTMPENGPLFKYPEIRGLRILIGHGIANSTVPLSTVRRDFKLLYSAGLPVKFNTYATNHRLHPRMLRDIDSWIMDGVETCLRTE